MNLDFIILQVALWCVLHTKQVGKLDHRGWFYVNHNFPHCHFNSCGCLLWGKRVFLEHPLGDLLHKGHIKEEFSLKPALFLKEKILPPTPPLPSIAQLP